MKVLTGKKTLITGGASGIGEATTRLFLEAGAEVFIVDHDTQRVESLKTELNNPRLHSYIADLRNNDDIRRYSAQALETLGEIDVAIFNAGICGDNTPLEDYNSQEEPIDPTAPQSPPSPQKPPDNRPSRQDHAPESPAAPNQPTP